MSAFNPIEVKIPQAIITAFIDYAKAQGSQDADRYRTSITDCIMREVGEDLIRDASCPECLLPTAEVIAKVTLRNGMAEQLPYKVIFNFLNRQMKNFAVMIAGERAQREVTQWDTLTGIRDELLNTTPERWADLLSLALEKLDQGGFDSIREFVTCKVSKGGLGMKVEDAEYLIYYNEICKPEADGLAEELGIYNADDYSIYYDAMCKPEVDGLAEELDIYGAWENPPAEARTLDNGQWN